MNRLSNVLIGYKGYFSDINCIHRLINPVFCYHGGGAGTGAEGPRRVLGKGAAACKLKTSR